MNRTIVILLLGVLVSTAAEKKAFGFSGNTSIETEYAYRDPGGAQLDREPFAWNMRIRPTLTMWGMPLNLNFLLSSYDVDFRQLFNRFKFALPMLAMPDLKLNVPWLEIQLLDARSSYSDYSLNGINVRGGAIDIKPGKFRLSFTGGQVQRGVIGSEDTDVAYRRWLYAGRVGVGKEEKSHLHLHFVKAWDDSASIPRYLGIVTDGSEQDTVQLEYPIENAVASLEGKVALFEGKLSFDGELAGSAYNRSTESAEIDNEYVNWIPEFVFTPRWSSQVDWAGKVGSELSLGNTRLGLGLEQVGWGFESVGISFADQDSRTLSASFSQMFMKPLMMMIDLSADVGRDNLDGMKRVTSRTRGGSVNFGLYPQNVPNLNVGYAPCLTKAPESDAGGDEVDNITHVFWGSSSCSFDIAERSNTVSLILNLSNQKDRISPDNDNLTLSAGGNVSHQLLNNLSLDWNAGAISTLGAGTSHVYYGGLRYSLSLWEKRWKISCDANFQTTVNRPEDKLTIRLNNGVEIFENFVFDVSGQFQTYHGQQADQDYTETLARAGVSYRW